MNLQTFIRAYEFAKTAHEGQVRKTGEPYITHPVAVAEIASRHVRGTTIVEELIRVKEITLD